MLDSKIQQLKDHFGITHAEDWQSVEPAWILRQDGIGPVTLEHIRIYLAARDLTLKNDKTPEYWRQHLSAVKVGHVMGNAELIDDVDRGVICPFTVIIDSAEQHNFTFQGFRTDNHDSGGPGKPLVVPTEVQALGRGETGMGDYSLSTGLNRCHVERKSLPDAHSTFLGWAKKGEDCGRRDRFEQELGRLSDIEAGLIVVECSFADLVRHAPQYGVRSAAQNAKTLFNSVLAWQQDYTVPWLFCENRRMAETAVLNWFRRWHRKNSEAVKAEEKRLAKERKLIVEHEQRQQQPAALPLTELPSFDAALAALL